MTRSEAIVLGERLRAEYAAFVDANTRPRSRAAAAFTVRQAEDLKAGYADGITAVIAELSRAGGVFEP